MSGILAVFNDVDAGCDRAAYEDWYQRDHLPDRLAVPGFRHARRYRRIEGGLPEYFTFYETDGAQVLRSAAYLARLAAPTAGTVVMMRHFRAMCRSVCTVAGEAGGGIGGVVAVVGSAAAVPGAGAAEVLRGVLARGMVARARLWLAAEDVAANPEAALRPEADARLGGILVVEGTVAEAVRAAAARGAAALGLAGETGVYGLMFADGTA